MGSDLTLAGVVIFFLVLIFVAAIVPTIFFVYSLQQTLQRVAPQNRAMSPGLVWLYFVPVFGWGWFAYTVVKIRDAARAEYRSRGWTVDSDFGYSIGIATAVLQPIAYAGSWLPERMMPMSLVLLLGSLVCWIIYWVRVARLKNRLGPPAIQPFYIPGPGQGQGLGPGAFPGAGQGPGAKQVPGAQQAPGAGHVPGSDDASERGSGPESDEVLLCPVCASPTKAGDRFCIVCGRRLPWDEQ